VYVNEEDSVNVRNDGGGPLCSVGGRKGHEGHNTKDADDDGKNKPITGPDRPCGFQGVRLPDFRTIGT